MGACGRCRRTSAKIQKKCIYPSQACSFGWLSSEVKFKEPLKQKGIFISCRICVRVKWEYLIKEGVVSSLDPCPVGLFTHTDLHHWFDVVAWQLTGLNYPDTNLKKHIITEWGWRHTIYDSMRTCDSDLDDLSLFRYTDDYRNITWEITQTWIPKLSFKFDGHIHKSLGRQYIYIFLNIYRAQR